MASMLRATAVLAAAACVGMTLQGCAKAGYKVKEKGVYSNSKYLADLQHDMSLKKCKHYCSNWGDVCEDLCKKEKKCGLTDDVDARHFTRETSCKKKCVGFNMHGEEHCTLFADNVALSDGGRGTFYGAPGASLRGNGGSDEESAEDDKHDSGNSDKGNSGGNSNNGNNNGNNNNDGNNGGNSNGNNAGHSNDNNGGNNAGTSNDNNGGSYGGNSNGNNNGGSYGGNSNNGNNNDGNNGGNSNENSGGNSKGN